VTESSPRGVPALRRLDWWTVAAVLVVVAIGRHQRRRSLVATVTESAPRPEAFGRPVPTQTSRRKAGWWLATAALVLVGTGCIVFGVRDQQRALAGPVTWHTVAMPAVHSITKTEPSKPLPLAAVRSTPVELQIPAIGLTESLSTLGLNADGTVQVPTDVQQPGWYRLGPSPGQIGSAVILGHVDSYQGPAAFYKLRLLVTGDLIDVTLADGVTAEFKVTSVVEYLKATFPDQAVYASHGYSALQLVTCTGVFDSATGHYLSNIVVYSTLAGLKSPGA
jgi:sortase (surface protein transpeptidase)